MALDFNPFSFDFSSNFGVALFIVMIALSVFTFTRRMFRFSGGIIILLGLLLLFNNINFVIAIIFFIVGIAVAFMGD